LAQKIDQEQQQVETLSNQFDAAQLHVQQVQQQVTAAQHSLSSDQSALDSVRLALTREAVNAYTTGGFAASPTASPAANLDPLVASSYFEAATGNQTDAEDQYRLAERNVATQQQNLQQTESAANQALSTLGARRSAAQAAQQQATATLDSVNGQIAQLVAQQQAQQQAQLKAQQLAAYNAQLAAQRQAAANQHTASLSDASGLTSTSGSSSSTSGTTATTGSTTGATDPTSTTTQPSGPTTTTPPVSIPGLTGAAATAVSVALAQVGKPYQWGAEGPDSFDCSGLVTYAYAAAGISLDHYTGAQWSETTQIPLADAQAGDLIFFNGLGHVGIYLGNGMMVDAPHTGADVRVESIFGFGSIDGATRVT